jgi:hypothetical protein
MNKSTILALTLAGGAAWLWWRNSSGDSGSITLEQIAKLLDGKGTGTGGGSDKASPVATLAQQLRAAAGVDLGNADEWNYFLARIAGRKPVDGEPFMKAFFPDGRPEGEAAKLTPEQFVTQAKAAGGVGLDGIRRISGGRGPVVIDLAAVRL